MNILFNEQTNFDSNHSHYKLQEREPLQPDSAGWIYVPVKPLVSPANIVSVF